MSTNNMPELLYNKLQSGQELSDDEILKGLAFFQNLTLQLSRCGPVFYLATNEANYAYRSFLQYAGSRNLIIPTTPCCG